MRKKREVREGDETYKVVAALKAEFQMAEGALGMMIL